MITEKMKEWLLNLPENPKHDSAYCVQVHRIQKRIDQKLELLLWLCMNHPEVFLYEHSYERMRTLLLCVKLLNPKCNIIKVVKGLKFPSGEE